MSQVISGIDYVVIEDSNAPEEIDTIVIEVGTQGPKGEDGDPADLSQLDLIYLRVDSSGLVPTAKIRTGTTTVPGTFMYARGTDVAPANNGPVTENSRVVTPAQVSTIATNVARKEIAVAGTGTGGTPPESLETITASTVSGTIFLDATLNKRFFIIVDRACTISVVNVVPSDPTISRGLRFTLMRSGNFSGNVVVNGIDIFLPKDQGQPQHNTKPGFGEMYNVSHDGGRVIATVIENIQFRYRTVMDGLIFNIPYFEVTGNDSSSILNANYLSSAGDTAAEGEATDPTRLAGGGKQVNGSQYERLIGSTLPIHSVQTWVRFGSVNTGSFQTLWNIQRPSSPGHSNFALEESGGVLSVAAQSAPSTTTGWQIRAITTTIPIVAGVDYSIGVGTDPYSATDQALQIYVRRMDTGAEWFWFTQRSSSGYTHAFERAGEPMMIFQKSNNGRRMTSGSRIYGIVGYNRRLTIAEFRANAIGYR